MAIDQPRVVVVRVLPGKFLQTARESRLEDESAFLPRRMEKQLRGERGDARNGTIYIREGISVK